MTPKLVAFDLDGTLTESKSPMTPNTGALLARLMHKVPVAVLSGASLRQFEEQFLAFLPADAPLKNLYLLPTNAAQCYVYRGTWEPLYQETLTPQEKEGVLAALDESLHEVKFVHPPQVWGPQVEDRGEQITFSALGQEAPVEEKKKFDPTREIRMPLAEALRRRLPNFHVGLNAATSIDITRKGVTKAYGVRRLSEMTGIDIADMLYVGDALGEGGNDAVVIDTGIPTRAVPGPAETAKLIEELAAQP